VSLADWIGLGLYVLVAVAVTGYVVTVHRYARTVDRMGKRKR
jgi:uncharacterized membrane protein